MRYLTSLLGALLLAAVFTLPTSEIVRSAPASNLAAKGDRLDIETLDYKGEGARDEKTGLNICFDADSAVALAKNLVPDAEHRVLNGDDARGYVGRLTQYGVFLAGDTLPASVLVFTVTGYPFVAAVPLRNDGMACMSAGRPVPTDIHRLSLP